MTEEVPRDTAWKHRELMLKVARRPGFCCCCVCIPSEDRRRARRVFRLTRRVMRTWEAELRERDKSEARTSMS